MPSQLLLGLVVSVTALAATPYATAQSSRPPVPNRAVYLDNQGVVRWRDNRQEVRLFGANYVVTTASDYRAAGYVGADRKRMIDEDMAHFARMGWDGIRLTFWGDWQSADSAGNLIANDHLELLDYLILKARERGIYMLFSPIQLYSSNWPDALHLDPSTPGFGRVFGKERMGKDPAAIAAQANYLRQILNHVNPHTGVAIKDEPAIVFIELVNEPWHHPEDLPGSIRYINTLTEAVRSTGCNKLIFYNVSQDFRISEAIRRSKAQGITFGWYPTGLNSGHELEGNYLRTVDSFPDMVRPDLAHLPRIVYEFDVPDTRSGAVYVAMARTFRAVGTQFAAMFSYDMLGTASRNLGWQTHYLNLVYTPRKAMGSIIAAEVMRRLPRMGKYGSYPENSRFGDFQISYDGDRAELLARDAFLYTATTQVTPPAPAELNRIAGTESSPLVRYDGAGIYFLDKVRAGVWRLEVYPDAVPVRDPFEPPNADKVVTRAISRPWPMTVVLPDLGESFSVQPVSRGAGAATQASAGRFSVTPGVYVLSTGGAVDLAGMPSHIGPVGFAEFFPPPPDTLPLMVQPLNGPEYLAGRDGTFRVRIVDQSPPDSATLFFRRSAGDWYRAYPLRPSGAYQYAAMVPAALMREGPSEFVVSVFRGGKPVTYPGGLDRIPWSWDYHGRDSWKVDVADRRTPVRLFEPDRDAPRLAFTRIGDAGRRGLFRVTHSTATGRAAFHLELPVDSSGLGPDDYTASLVVKDRIVARQETIVGLDTMLVRLRGVGPRQTVHITLMEDDGTSWTAAIPLDSSWVERSLPLNGFRIGRGVKLPQGFPGQWSYWLGPATGRGGSGDRLRIERLERVQISVRRETGVALRPGSYGVEIESITLRGGGVTATAPEPAADCCTLSLQVQVPEGTGPLYLAGNLPQLGPWRPDGLRLEGDGRSRTARVKAPAGTTFEYKFTLGSWDREALNRAGSVPPNHQLAVVRDTAVTHEVTAFKRDPRDYIADWRGSGVRGRLVYWTDVRSAHLRPTRHVEIWLPPGYDSSSTRYPVIYMHDGQNLFDPRIANTGVDWGVDESVVRLVERGVISPVIVVGVWSTAERGPEYSPWQGANRYARFLIEELMPRVNREFRTLTGPANSAVIGSSMGGLLSFYLVTKHPDQFGACGCVSTHFPLSESVMRSISTGSAAGARPDTVPYITRDIAAGLKAPPRARYWFDYGTEGIDAVYGPTHQQVGDWLRRQGRVEGRDFVIRRYEGATHNEAAWRARLDDVLTFLFGKPRR